MPQLEEYLKEEKHAFENKEILCVLHVLHDLDYIWEGLPVLLHLIAHGCNIIEKNGICLAACSDGVVTIVARLAQLHIPCYWCLFRVLAGRSMRGTSTLQTS
jgi:hypothetical protein